MVTEFENFIFDKLESESDGWQTTYPYSEVVKAMMHAYNLALDHAAEKANISEFEKIDGELVLMHEIDEMWADTEMGDIFIGTVNKQSILRLKIVSK